MSRVEGYQIRVLNRAGAPSRLLLQLRKLRQFWLTKQVCLIIKLVPDFNAEFSKFCFVHFRANAIHFFMEWKKKIWFLFKQNTDYFYVSMLHYFGPLETNKKHRKQFIKSLLIMTLKETSTKMFQIFLESFPRIKD